ncbi:MAG: polyribonucleotide nucleotidyltransferase, partial [Candidatus Paceibacterota bacterium]
NLDDKELTDELIDTVYDDESGKYEKGQIANAIFALIRDKIRSGVLKDGKRFDGRGLEDIRELYAEVSVLPRTHGSALFRRGMTEVMSIATLGSSTLEQLIEGPEGQEAKRYIHHYYSPPYSYGEVGRVGWPSPREIGHGALAEKALIPVLPSKEEFPYVIRIVSEILSSNGSTSMAATCGSTLSLMDTGVPITSPVAGVSVGLMWESDDNYKLLTDIAGVEDFTGDMDFKIAGTADGIPVIQLDVKIEGVTLQVVQETFEQSKRGRLKILEMMHGVIAAPRKSVSKYAPKIVVLAPPEDKVGEIIGPGGKNIRAIIAQTNTDINVDNDNKVSVSGINQAEVDKAVELIENIYRSVEIGEEFDAEVKRLMPFGAFVEFLPGKEGLIHVSQMGKGFVKDPADVVKEGDKIRVKVIKVDDRGKVGLSLLR